MRVIAGKLGGRVFASPHGHRTHPMSEKARGAIFNALGDVEGLTVLDAFAGSGALGIEAISRGAASVVTVELDKNAVRTIRENIATLGLEGVLSVTQQNVSSWSDDHTGLVFDLVFADPPYDDIRPVLLEKLARHLKPEGIFVLSWPGRAHLPTYTDMDYISNKLLGDIQICFYRKSS